MNIFSGTAQVIFNVIQGIKSVTLVEFTVDGVIYYITLFDLIIFIFAMYTVTNMAYRILFGTWHRKD